MVRILLILLSVSVLFCLGLVWQNSSLVEDNEELADDIIKYQSTIASKEATISSLQQDLTLKEKIAIERQQKTIELQSILTKTKGELDKLGDADETVKDWATQPVPSSVSRLLNKASSIN